MSSIPKENRPALIQQYQQQLAAAEAAVEAGVAPDDTGGTAEREKLLLEAVKNRAVLSELQTEARVQCLQSLEEEAAMIRMMLVPDSIIAMMLRTSEDQDAEIRILRDQLEIDNIGTQTQTPPAPAPAVATPRPSPPPAATAATKPPTPEKLKNALPEGMPTPSAAVKHVTVGNIPNTYRAFTKISTMYQQMTRAGNALNVSRRKLIETRNENVDKAIARILEKALKNASDKAKPTFVLSRVDVQKFDKDSENVINGQISEMMNLRKQRAAAAAKAEKLAVETAAGTGSSVPKAEAEKVEKLTEAARPGSEIDLLFEWSRSFSGKDNKAKIAKAFKDLHEGKLDPLKGELESAIQSARDEYAKNLKLAEVALAKQLKEVFVLMGQILREIWKEDTDRTPRDERVKLVFRYLKEVTGAVIGGNPLLQEALAVSFKELENQTLDMMKPRPKK